MVVTLNTDVPDITHKAIDPESRNHFHRVAIPYQGDPCRDDAIALLHSISHGDRVAVCFAQLHVANHCDLASALLNHHENGIAVRIAFRFHDRIQRHDWLCCNGLLASDPERDDHAG